MLATAATGLSFSDQQTNDGAIRGMFPIVVSLTTASISKFSEDSRDKEASLRCVMRIP